MLCGRRARAWGSTFNVRFGMKNGLLRMRVIKYHVENILMNRSQEKIIIGSYYNIS